MLIPENLCRPTSNVRLSLYRRLAEPRSRQDREALAAELIDRFGPLPPEADQLLKVVAIKRLCREANVPRSTSGRRAPSLAFRDNHFPRPERLVGWIADSRGRMRVRPDHRVVLLQETTTPAQRLKAARTVVGDLARLAA